MRTICLIAFSVLPICLSAQSFVKAEANYEFSRLSSQFGSSSYSPTQSSYGGLAYETKLLKWLSVSPGIAILRRGQDRDSLTSEKIRLTYVNLQCPLLIYPFPEEKLQFFFLLGPYLGIKTDARLYNVHFSFNEKPLDFSADFDSRTKSTDYGVIFGTGLSYSFGKLGVSASAKYHLGLTPISDINPYLTSPNSDFVDAILGDNRKIRAYGGSLGIFYKLSGK